MNNSLFEILKIFSIIGIQLLGGGYVIVPLLKKYLVEERKWMSEEELVNFYAMSQCLPGIIACNIAICAGYKARGILGSIMAVLGIILPSFICIILLANVLSAIVSYNIIKNAFWGIRISVIILILVTIKDIWSKSVNSKYTYLLFFTVLFSFLLLPLSPAVIIILSALISLIYGSIKRGKNA